MSERNYLLTGLIQEVLGPRQGPYETLPFTQDPRDEYITGVLAPADADQPADDIDADVDQLIEETSSEEDQDTDGNIVVPGTFSPALRPQALPRSIGLSFTVEAYNEQPQFEICATWARYQLDQQVWRREPGAYLSGPVRAEVDNQLWRPANGVLLQLRSRPLAEGRWRISIYLVNVTHLSGHNGFATTQEHLFQPQIRVHCCPGTVLLPVFTLEGDNNHNVEIDSLIAEDISLSLLYRNRTAFARGHLCGAIWRNIDPERPLADIPSPQEAPFAWIDGIIISEQEREKFSPADVRTELVPCYPVKTPDMEWNPESGEAPQLNPEHLAEIWQPEQVRSSLYPLVEAYENWIREQQALITDLQEAHQPIALSHLTQCQTAANRIREAIEIVASDEDVRLAFCFANEAIAIQSRWSRGGEVIHWRPFQLAFILLNIPALADPLHGDRRTCDLLWFPTGGGKTEAYLGLAAFTLALRRRRAGNNADGQCIGAGVGVLSRYTLRLLTIQQFRRALGVVTACEMLRVHGLDTPHGNQVGWRPRGCPSTQTFIWGGQRFSAGLWVGGGVTPNSLLSIGPLPNPNSAGMTFIAGALDILKGASERRDYDGPDLRLRQNLQSSNLQVEGEPAQVLTCPSCREILAVPDDGIGPGPQTLHFVFQGGNGTGPALATLQPANLPITLDRAVLAPTAGCNTLSVTFTVHGSLSARQIDAWWYQTIVTALGNGVQLLAARPARPGYFICTYDNSLNNARQCGFDIYCPNPNCELNQHSWSEQVPVSRAAESAAPAGGGPVSIGVAPNDLSAGLPSGRNMQWEEIPPGFRIGRTRYISSHIPIPAHTVDDQVYHRCPSLIIATVDKFARLAFEPKAASLFGNVSHYHARWGYYREGCPPSTPTLPAAYLAHPPGRSAHHPLHIPVSPFLSPDLILQDELHLIEGPLGSMVGLYETAIDLLCQRQDNHGVILPKYIASTATVRQAETQVQALFDRQLAQFPPSALSSDDRFFARDREVHPLEADDAGRLYIAICAPGKGAQTPIVRIWSALLQEAYNRWRANPGIEADNFWTLVGYFNALRELAGARALLRQDILQRMEALNGADARPIDQWVELSSQASPLKLPGLLESLTRPAPDSPDAVFATSMFGTGVDVDRLGLMIVHGQPKTTASYIQATGRVGRRRGGLVITFFRASRPRDLDHYEFFTGYHRALYRHVEPVTVAPFSPRARERALGPIAVILLRQARDLAGIPVDPAWRVQQRLNGSYFAQARRMATARFDPEVTAIPDLLEARATMQPDGRRPPADITSQEASAELDVWHAIAVRQNNTNDFVYYEPALFRLPVRDVVLGDAHHRANNLREAYENAPQSLREVEETTGFKS